MVFSGTLAARPSAVGARLDAFDTIPLSAAPRSGTVGAVNRTRWLIAVLLLGCSGSPGSEAAKTKAAPAAKGNKAEVAKAPEVEASDTAPGDAAPDPTEALVVPTPVSGPAPKEFEGDDGLFGFRAEDGAVVIPATYQVVMPFVDQVAAVVSPDDGWIFIDRTGHKLAKAFVFDNAADDFVEGHARIVDGDRYGFISSTGAVVVKPTWSFVDRFSGGMAAVCEGCVREPMGEHFTMTGGKWGYVDSKGTVVIKPRFSRAEPFTDGQAQVREGTREFVIGPDGAERTK
jgi:hypothetical protein